MEADGGGADRSTTRELVVGTNPTRSRISRNCDESLRLAFVSLLISSLTGQTGCITFLGRFESLWILSVHLLKTRSPKFSNSSCLLPVFQVPRLGPCTLKASPFPPCHFHLVTSQYPTGLLSLLWFHLHGSRKMWQWAIWVKNPVRKRRWNGWRKMI